MPDEYPGNIYLLKVGSRDIRERYWIMFKVNNKDIKKSHWYPSGAFVNHFWQLVSIVDFEQTIKNWLKTS